VKSMLYITILKPAKAILGIKNLAQKHIRSSNLDQT